MCSLHERVSFDAPGRGQGRFSSLWVRRRDLEYHINCFVSCYRSTVWRCQYLGDALWWSLILQFSWGVCNSTIIVGWVWEVSRCDMMCCAWRYVIRYDVPYDMIREKYYGIVWRWRCIEFLEWLSSRWYKRLQVASREFKPLSEALGESAWAVWN